MTRGPMEEDLESLGEHAAERFRQFSDRRYPDGIPHSPLPEDAAEEEQEVDKGEDVEGTMEEEGADTGLDEDLDPRALGGHAAERLREFIDQRYPDGIPYSPLPEDAAGEEPDVDAIDDTGPVQEQVEADAAPDSDPTRLGGHAAERLREFIDQRYPDGIPYSPLPEDAAKDESGNEAADEQGGVDADYGADHGTEQSEV